VCLSNQAKTADAAALQFGDTGNHGDILGILVGADIHLGLRVFGNDASDLRAHPRLVNCTVGLQLSVQLAARVPVVAAVMARAFWKSWP